MLLSTLICAYPGCGVYFSTDYSMYTTVRQAEDEGWLVEGDDAWCPTHRPAVPPSESWAVGCWTCGWEDDDEPISSQEEAKSIARDHECETDTWIKSPEKLREERERRHTYEEEHRKVRAKEDSMAIDMASAALDRQLQIEGWANRWLRLRNTVVFWRREHINKEEA